MGKREGANARPAWDQMHRKPCGERGENFYAAARRKSNGIFKSCIKCSSGFCGAKSNRKKVEKGKGVWYTLPILKTRHIFLCKFLKGERF